MTLIKRIFQDIRGASTIEYCLILVLISVAGLTTLDGVSAQLQSTYNTLGEAFKGSVADD